MQTTNITILTRTPLHVGAGASIGAIDLTIQRERHTGFPIIPGSSLKGSFAAKWAAKNNQLGKNRVTTSSEKDAPPQASKSAWLFGSDSANTSFAGSLQFVEARLLAFPIRSAHGSYAWITSPILLQRAKRDGLITSEIPTEPEDEKAIFNPDGPLALQDSNSIVLEDYAFDRIEDPTVAESIAQELASLTNDEILRTIEKRLAIVSDGTLAHFVTTTCEVAQRNKIDDATGVTDDGALFNQENVPADTLFYTSISALDSLCPHGNHKDKSASDAAAEISKFIEEDNLFQFGGDASTGLGFCTLTIPGQNPG